MKKFVFFIYVEAVIYIETFYRSAILLCHMHKIKCKRCGGEDAEILWHGKFASNVIYCPHCDDICNRV
jgi:late competence protein required for DNA uptake (superfamily II DNA/RNA helicase)